MDIDLIHALKDAYPHMTTEKARALIDQIGPAAAQALLGMTSKAEKATISYKGATSMTRTHTTTVAAEANAFETSLKGIPPQLHDGLWSYWASHPALAGLTVAKIKAPLTVERLKAPMPADVIDAAIEELRAAATQAAARTGDKSIADAIRTLARQFVPEATGSGHLADTEKTTKQAPKMIPFDALLQGSARAQASDARTIGSHYDSRLRGK